MCQQVMVVPQSWPSYLNNKDFTIGRCSNILEYVWFYSLLCFNSLLKSLNLIEYGKYFLHTKIKKTEKIFKDLKRKRTQKKSEPSHTA